MCNDLKVALRFQSSEKANSGLASTLLTVLCQDCSLTLPHDAAARIGPFFATDLTAESMPLLLTLRKFQLTVLDQSGCAPTSGVRIDDLTCIRGRNGIFSIEPGQSGTSKTASLSLSVGDSKDQWSASSDAAAFPSAAAAAAARLLLLKQKQSLIAQEIRALQREFHDNDA